MVQSSTSMEQFRIFRAHPQVAEVEVYLPRIPKDKADCIEAELMSLNYHDDRLPFVDDPVKWLLSA